METTFLAFAFPVWSAAEKLIRLCFHEANLATPICTYFPSPDSLGWLFIIQDVVSVFCLWMANISFRYPKFHSHKIGSHLLRSGGAMTFHQAGISVSTTNVIDWWQSTSLLVYLHGQVLNSPKG